MSEGQRCLYIVVLLIHTTIGTGEGPTSPPSPRSSTFRIEDNELTGTFPPFEDIFGQVPEKQFVTENNTVVTSQIGSTALIPCVIRNIGDGIISWIRRKDYHLLTVGLTTYSSDQRFQAIHLQHSEDWTLKVKFVQKRDAGIYECQVSSHPPTSIFLRLDVVDSGELIHLKVLNAAQTCPQEELHQLMSESVSSEQQMYNIIMYDDDVSAAGNEARAQISGPTEKYLKPGSTLRLQCSVVQTTEAPAFVFWYHNNRMINYDAERGVNVTTDPEQRLSYLLIPVAGINHAGNYTCVPNNAVPASIYVHIFNGENPAAMQSSSPKYLQLSSVTYIYTLTATYLIIR